MWKEKYNNYFVISRLDGESPEYQLAMFKHVIGDDGLKVIKSFTYSKGENGNDWRFVMGKIIGLFHSTFCFAIGLTVMGTASTVVKVPLT